MKTKSYSSQRGIFRGRMQATSLLALGLLAGAAYAQSSSASSSSNPDTLQNSSSTSDPSRNGAYDPATSPDRSNSSRPTSSGYSDQRSDDSGLKHGDKRFITKASESAEREIVLSQLAATRATNPQIRSYAQQLVSGHQQMEQELAQLAQRKGIVLDDVAALSTRDVSGSSSAANPTTNDSRSARSAEANSPSTSSASDQAMASNGQSATTSASVGMNNEATSDRHYRSLAKKSGAEFDKEYVEMMIKEHKSDVKLFQKAIDDAKDTDVRAFASRQLPALQAHLDQANSLGQIAAE